MQIFLPYTFECSSQYIDETEEIAMNGLMKNKHILHMLAEELVEKSSVTGLVWSKLVSLKLFCRLLLICFC